MPNPNLLLALENLISELAIETIFSHPETGYPVQVASRWERKGNVYRLSGIMIISYPMDRSNELQLRQITI